MSRIGTKILWTFKCSLCGRGFGDESKIIFMALVISMDKYEGSFADVQICNECEKRPISELIAYYKNMEDI